MKTFKFQLASIISQDFRRKERIQIVNGARESRSVSAGAQRAGTRSDLAWIRRADACPVRQNRGDQRRGGRRRLRHPSHGSQQVA